MTSIEPNIFSTIFVVKPVDRLTGNPNMIGSKQSLQGGASPVKIGRIINQSNYRYWLDYKP